MTFSFSIGNGFTYWDDALNLHQNERFNPPTAEGVLWYWRNPAADLYVPVTYTAWGLLAAVAYSPRADADGMHLDPAVFHLASVLAHGAAAVVVYAILRLLVRRPWAAVVGAVVFAVHPVQVEAVAWASGLKDVLAGFFSLVAIWQYLLFASAGNPASAGSPAFAGTPAIAARRFKRRRAHMAIALAAVALGVLSKPSAIVAPVVAGVLDVLVLGRPWRRAVFAAAALALIALPAAVEARLVQTARATPQTPIWERPLVAADALAFYLDKLVLPLRLAADYGRRPPVARLHGWLYWTWVFPAVAAGLAWRFRRGRPWLPAAALVFTAALSPVLGFVRFTFQFYSTVADHYLYLAMLGPALAAAGWAAEWTAGRETRGPQTSQARRWPGWAAWPCAFVLAALAVGSAAQSRVWRSSLSLWKHNIEAAPDSFVAHSNLGHALWLGEAGSGRNLDAAIVEFQKSIDMNPQYFPGHAALANALTARNGPGDKEAATQHTLTFARIQEDMGAPFSDKMASAYDAAARRFLQTGRRAEAAELFRHVLANRPRDADAADGLRTAEGK